MPTFKQGDVVRVPFPYTDRSTRQRRPALVVSNGGVGDKGGFLWVVMITSADNRSWPSDVALGPGYVDAGLPSPSVVRTARIATIDISAAEAVGVIEVAMMLKVRNAMIGLI